MKRQARLNTESQSGPRIRINAVKMAAVPMVWVDGSKASKAPKRLLPEFAVWVRLNISTEAMRKACRSAAEALGEGPVAGVNARTELRKESRVVGAFKAAADEDDIIKVLKIWDKMFVLSFIFTSFLSKLLDSGGAKRLHLTLLPL